MAIQLEEFPLEVQIIIMGKLDVNTLLKLRLINKNFRDNIIPNVRIRRLSVRNCLNSNDREFVYRRFFHSNEMLEDFNCFSSANCDFFKRKLMKLLFSKLQKIFIIGQNSRGHQVFNINEIINQIKTLEELEIHDIRISKGRIIRLPNLKNLCIENLITTSNNCLKLDLPNLIVFKTNNRLGNFEFIYYDKLEYLYLHKVYLNSKSQLSLFTNLKYFFIVELIFYENFMYFISNFKKLKELHFYTIRKQDLQNLLKNVKTEIYLRGIKIDKLKDIDKYYDDQNELKDINNFIEFTVHEETYKIMPWYHQINYTDLIKMFCENIPKNYISKFLNIYKLIINDSKLDQTLFIAFIENLKVLSNLKINNNSLDSHFYSNLYKYCPHLKKLAIKSIENSKFLLDIKYLRKITIRSNISLDLLIIVLFNSEKRLPTIKIINRKIIIRKLNYHFEIEVSVSAQSSRKIMVMFANKNVLINFFKMLNEIKLNQNFL